MSTFERSYGKGRGLVGVVAFAGWVVALVGLAVAVMGLVSLLGAADRPGAMAQFTAIAAGLGAALVGLVGVAAAQHMRATFDIADMTREMLVLARRRPAVPASVQAIVPAASGASARPVLPPLTGGSRAPLRAEAEPAIPPRPQGAGGKVHPIFSARPPR